MKRSKKQYAKCPCCQIEKYKLDLSSALALIVEFHKKEGSDHKSNKIDSYGYFIDTDFEWACDDCLNLKKAILANPRLQNYCWYPHLAYSDDHFNCDNCKQSFIFSKEEKKHWYEKLKFWVDAYPDNCLSCRKEIRLLKVENKTLSELLRKEENDLTIKDLETIVLIYKKWNKINRQKYYQSLFNNKSIE